MNFELLGTFIGDEKSTKTWLDEKLKCYKKFMNILKFFENKQVQWTILHYQSGYGKYMNLIRTIPLKFLIDFII